jgi:hypothetical protein
LCACSFWQPPVDEQVSRYRRCVIVLERDAPSSRRQSVALHVRFDAGQLDKFTRTCLDGNRRQRLTGQASIDGVGLS